MLIPARKRSLDLREGINNKNFFRWNFFFTLMTPILPRPSQAKVSFSQVFSNFQSHFLVVLGTKNIKCVFPLNRGGGNGNFPPKDSFIIYALPKYPRLWPQSLAEEDEAESNTAEI